MRISDWSSDVCSSDREVPLETLLSDSYNAQRRALIGDSASADFRPGSPDGRRPRLPSYRIADENSIDINAILGVGEPTVAEAGEPVCETTGVMRGDTCHIHVVDRWENGTASGRGKGCTDV